MEALSNLSCCFDASKDVGETSIELFVCNCAVSKRCCLRWEAFTYVMAVAFSTMDFVADLLGYVSFVNILSDPQPIQTYINVWLAFLIISGVILVSEVILPLYNLCVIKPCSPTIAEREDAVDKERKCTKYWNRFNTFAVVLSEDGIIALVRILIAFKSVEAVDDLQSVQGQVSAIIALVVTLLRHFLLIVQLIAKMSRNELILSRCPSYKPGTCPASTKGLYVFYFTIMFISSCALGATGMSMAISLDLITVHQNDDVDFQLNTVLLAVFIPGSYLVSVATVIISRW